MAFFFCCYQQPSRGGGRAVEEIEREMCKEKERERDMQWREKESDL